MDDFVNAGSAARRSFASAPRAEFDFGPYRVTSEVTVPTGLPRRGAGSKTWLEVLDPVSRSTVVCEFERVGMPIGSESLHGIGGNVAGGSFLVRRNGGPKLRRKDRVVEVSGMVDLALGYEHRRSVIRAKGDPARVLWTAMSGGLLSRDASHREAAVICALVVSSVDQSSSLLRFLSNL